MAMYMYNYVLSHCTESFEFAVNDFAFATLSFFLVVCYTMLVFMHLFMHTCTCACTYKKGERGGGRERGRGNSSVGVPE